MHLGPWISRRTLIVLSFLSILTPTSLLLADPIQPIRPIRPIVTPTPTLKIKAADILKNPALAAQLPAKKNAYFAINKIALESNKMAYISQIKLPTQAKITLMATQAPENNVALEYLSIPKGTPIGTHSVQWKATTPSARCGIVQISAYPFNASRDWNSPVGLIAEQLHCPANDKVVPQTLYYTPFDFDHLEKYPLFSYKAPLSLIRPGVSRLNLAEADRSPLTKFFFKTGFYYLRVVPVSGGNLKPYKQEGEISNTATLFYHGKAPSEVVIQSGFPQVHAVGFTKMRHDHYNFFCYMRSLKNVEVMGAVLFKKGSVYNVCETSDDDGGFLDSVGDFFDGMVNFVRDAINYVSQLYDTIKAGLVDAIMQISGCTTNTCKSILCTALNTGLIALGMPPELPNFNQLVDLGSDYFAEVIASQTGLPPEVTEMGTDKIAQSIKDSSQKSSPAGRGEQFEPAAEYNYRPAMIAFMVDKNTSYASKTEGATLRISEIAGTHFTDSIVQLPANPSGQAGSYRVNVFLNPVMEIRSWYSLYQLGMQRLQDAGFNLMTNPNEAKRLMAESKSYFAASEIGYQSFVTFYPVDGTYRFKVSLVNSHAGESVLYNLRCQGGQCAKE